MESFLCSSVKFANCVDNCQFCKDCKLCTEHAANFLTDVNYKLIMDIYYYDSVL